MKLIPLVSIHVSRNGDLVTPPIGKPFDFTETEKDDIDTLSEKTKADYYRLPVNEDGDDVAAKKLGAKTAAEKKAEKAAATAGGNTEL